MKEYSQEKYERDFRIQQSLRPRPENENLPLAVGKVYMNRCGHSHRLVRKSGGFFISHRGHHYFANGQYRFNWFHDLVKEAKQGDTEYHENEARKWKEFAKQIKDNALMGKAIKWEEVGDDVEVSVMDDDDGVFRVTYILDGLSKGELWWWNKR